MRDTYNKKGGLMIYVRYKWKYWQKSKLVTLLRSDYEIHGREQV